MKRPKKTQRLCDASSGVDLETRKRLWSDMSEDLPDGAALAMMEEFGVGVEDFDD